MARRKRVRIAGYVDPDSAELFEAAARKQGVTTSQLVERMVEDWVPSPDQYISRMQGHQQMMALTLIAALAKRTLSDKEFADAKSVGIQAGKAAFGELPPRPFTIDLDGKPDPRIEALHTVLFDR